MRTVLDNLLGNAWKYSRERDITEIEFGVRDINGMPTYYVKDNGAGFDMADAERLFNPFQRLPGAEKEGGFGIGLATVDRVIRRHGGRVCAEGALGKGATFFFTLPS
jgi:signal transduction histidine kinase